MFIPYLDAIDAPAAKIGAVNTVVNTGGKLKGYNTDYLGLKALIEKNKVSLEKKTVLILGSGGTSLTARQVALDMGAAEVKRVSRAQKEDCITYDTAYRAYSGAQVLINTTPVGMFPHTDGCAAQIDNFPSLEAVLDVVYHPIRTDLVLRAEARGITAEGGLFMLVAQAVYASELFLNTKYPPQAVETAYKSLLAQRLNIVLSGMPGSGKSTVGKLLASSLNKELADTDALVEQIAQMPISAIFENAGEGRFRRLESAVIRELGEAAAGKVISLGGGAVLSPENVRHLKHNGKIYFLDRPLADLVPTADRPLALDREAIEKRYEERYEIYCGTADRRIGVHSDAAGVAALIGKDLMK